MTRVIREIRIKTSKPLFRKRRYWWVAVGFNGEILAASEVMKNLKDCQDIALRVAFQSDTQQPTILTDYL